MASPTKHSFCDLCKNINVETLSSPDGLKHAETSMFSTKEQWCDLCRPFTHDKPLWYQKNFSLFLKPKNSTLFRSLGITWEGGDKSDAINYPMFTDEVRVRRKPDSPSSSTAYETAKAWLQECFSEHSCAPKVSSNEETAWMQGAPARLIDLEAFSKDSEDAKLIRVEKSNLLYATLSYCWGDTMPEGSTTTLSNIHRREERMEATGLPQTLRDALTVTRALGIRYLWVDALCIIQDSSEDWEFESAKMASIYGNSLVSIAVELNQHCLDGFLTCQPEAENICFNYMVKLSNTLSTGEESNLYVWVREICGCFVRDDIDHLRKTALSKRGWTYQERFLAPRILHFIGAQILWECRESHGIPLETGMALKDMEVLHKIPPIFGQIAKYALHPETQVEESELLDHWYENVVSEYCHRALSHKDDKLPAMSGIAKVFQNRLGYTYVAGLWLEDIAYGLCWATKNAAIYPAEYRAPTWTWTSVDGNVHWPGGFSTEMKHYIKIEDYHIQLTGSDPFGRICGGWLKLSGFIGHGIVKDRKLLCCKSDVELGYPYLDADRRMGVLEGMEIRYLILSTANGDKFNRLRALILREKGEAEGKVEGDRWFDRIGSVVSADMDVHLNAGWFERFCVRTTLKLF